MAAATLTSPLATPTGRRTATLTVTSDQATGTVYVVVTTSSTAPSHAQIVAGTDGSDVAAWYASSAAGALSNSFSMTDLRMRPNKLYAHFTQANGAAENSTPVTSAQWWPRGISYGTLTGNASTSVVTLRKAFLRASGTFDSATITFSYLSGNGSWIDISGAVYTAAGQTVVDFERPTQIRGTVTNAGASTSIAWEIR